MQSNTLSSISKAQSLPSWLVLCSFSVALAFLTAIPGAAQDKAAQPANQTPQPPVAVASGALPAHDAAAAPVADKQQAKPQTPEDPRKKEIADESAQLLNLAMALKAEVDKTTKDTLSLNVIRRAEQIEKLAKTVKEKIKVSGSGS